MNPKFPNNRETAYYKLSGSTGGFSPIIGSYYQADFLDMKPDKPVTVKTSDGTLETFQGKLRKGKPSIFNRYSIFYFNSVVGNSETPEPYMDMPNRLGSIANPNGNKIQSVLEFPTAKNIIAWSKQGGADKGTNAVEYDWEDFLWCKNYGVVPNNYMITLRRFPIPVTDDLLDPKKQPTPDIARLIAWVDGESNTWESVGLKFSSSLNWSELESKIQTLEYTSYGNEGNLFDGKLGNIIKQASFITQPGAGAAARGPKTAIDPYSNANVKYGPIDIIKKMMVRDSGLEFEQNFEIKFEYELKSIDGINPKIAMIDLLSNVLICTTNRASFWGGEIRYTGADPRRIRPLGDPSKLQSGDLGGYLKSLVGEISSRLESLTGGAGLSLEGIANAAKNLGGGLMDNIIGSGLDKMGRPGVQAVNALLSGEDTGEWHVMVGNPANPIISVGNLVLTKTEYSLHGALGPDDFPTKLTVTCSLKPARPRDRTDIMSMFHRNGRTVLTTAPSSTSYAGNLVKGGNPTKKFNRGDISAEYDENDYFREIAKETDVIKRRFPNHSGPGYEYILDNSAQGIF